MEGVQKADGAGGQTVLKFSKRRPKKTKNYNAMLGAPAPPKSVAVADPPVSAPAVPAAAARAAQGPALSGSSKEFVPSQQATAQGEFRLPQSNLHQGATRLAGHGASQTQQPSVLPPQEQQPLQQPAGGFGMGTGMGVGLGAAVPIAGGALSAAAAAGSSSAPAGAEPSGQAGFLAASAPGQLLQQQQATITALQQQMAMQQHLMQPDMMALHQQQQQQIAQLQQQLELLKMNQLQTQQASPQPQPQQQRNSSSSFSSSSNSSNSNNRKQGGLPAANRGQNKQGGGAGGGKPAVRGLPPPEAPASQQPGAQAKPATVWEKPKVWATRERTLSAENGDEPSYGDPDQIESDFVTKSDKQGKLYRNIGTKEGRAAIEQELFGADRHMTAGLDFDKYDDIPVEASGHGIPEPINSFDEANFCKALMDNIRRANYSRPTPIQKHAIPMSALGRDVMACAQTGSGKTAAFLFPIINNILAGNTPNHSAGRRGGRGGGLPGSGGFGGRRKCMPSALVLAPTRELASQIHDEAMRFTYQTNVRCVVLYGGADIRAQMDELARGCTIVVATPGRLVDLVSRNRVALAGIKHLVLDEADRMLDMGFEPQIRQIVQGFDMPQFDMSQGGRQTAMFSATFPQDIQQLAGDFMADYIFVTVGRVGSTNSSITQNLLWVEDSNKVFKLVEQLNLIAGLTLVFVETKRMADMLHSELFHKENIRCTSIHGDRSQREREQALWEFSTGRVTVLIATEVAARGLDIPDVMHVINYDLPSDIDSYVHRIGRTGRAGNKGVATSFVNEKNTGIARELVKMLEETSQDVPGWLNGLASQAEFGAGKFGRGGGGGGGRGGGGRSFGGRDFRKDEGRIQSATYSAGGKSGGGGGGGGGGGKSRGGRSRGGKSGGGGGGGSRRGGGGGQATATSDAW